MNKGGGEANLAQPRAGLAQHGYQAGPVARSAENAIATPAPPSADAETLAVTEALPAAAPAKSQAPLRPGCPANLAVSDGAVHLAVADASLRGLLSAALAQAGLPCSSFDGTAPLLAQLATLPAGCVLAADSELPRKLRAQGCVFPVVALTAEADVASAVLAMKAGAADVVTYPVRADDLAAAVHGALAQLTRRQAGESVLQAMRNRVDRLTRRERQVLDGMIRGAANKTIAHELNISPRTVEVHRANVMDKLGSRSLSQIIRMAVRLGLTTP